MADKLWAKSPSIRRASPISAWDSGIAKQPAHREIPGCSTSQAVAPSTTSCAPLSSEGSLAGWKGACPVLPTMARLCTPRHASHRPEAGVIAAFRRGRKLVQPQSHTCIIVLPAGAFPCPAGSPPSGLAPGRLIPHTGNLPGGRDPRWSRRPGGNWHGKSGWNLLCAHVMSRRGAASGSQTADKRTRLPFVLPVAPRRVMLIWSRPASGT